MGRNEALRAGTTEQVWTEEALQDAFQRLRDLESIVNKSPAVVFLRRASDGWPVEFVSENVVQFGYAPDEFLSGRVPYSSIVHPDDRERITSEVAQYTREGRTEFMQEYRIRSNSGKVRWLDDHVCVRRDASGNVTHYQGIVLDITDRKRGEETLRRQAEELAALQATVLDMTMQHDLPTLLRNIVERAAGLLDAPSGGLYLCDPDRREVRCVVSYNTLHDYTGTVLKYGEGAAGIVAQTGQPLIIDDYRTWSGRAAVYEKEQPFTGVLSAPLVWQGQVTGVVHVLHNVETRRFTAADLDLLTLFANHAAIAIKNARLLQEVQLELIERRRAEEALKESEEKYRNLVETSHDLIWSTDAQGHITFVNKAARRTYGYEPEEVIGRTFTSFLVPGQAEKDSEAFERAVRNGEVSINYETQVLRKDGGRAFLNVNAAVLRDAQGNLVGITGSAQDITERKRAEEALREKEARLRDLFDEAPVGYHEIDSQGRIMRVNRTELALLGYTAEEMLGRPVWEFILEQETSRQATLAKLAGGDVVPAYERTYLRKDGTRVPVLIEDRLLRDPGGQIAGNRSTIQDITERKRAEEKLRQAKDYAEKLIETANVIVVGLDTAGCVQVFNEAAEKSTGYTRAELAGRDYFEVLVPRDRYPHVWEAFGKLVTSGLPTFENPILTKSGEERLISWQNSEIREEGKIVGTISFGMDITERKRAEEALRVSHRFLEIANRHTHLISLLKEFVSEVQNFTGCGAVGIRMLDKEGNIPYQAHKGFEQRFYELESPLSIKSDQCMCINVITRAVDAKLPYYTEGGSFYINRSTRFLATVPKEEKGRTRNVCNQFGYESVALIPIHMGDDMLGLIHVADPQEDKVPLEMVEALEKAAGQLGQAIQRVRAEEALRLQTQQLEAVRAVTAEISRELDLAPLLELINRRAGELVGATSGTVRLWDEQAQLLIPVAWHGLGEWMKDHCRRLGEGVSGTVAQRREGMIVNDYRRSPYAHPATLERTKIAAVLAEPLIYRDRLLGVLTVDNHEPRQPFTEQDQELFRIFAAQAAIAIENARLVDELLRRQRELSALVDASGALTSSLDLDQILHTLVRQAKAISGAGAVRLFMLDDDGRTLRCRVGVGVPADMERDLTVPVGQSFSGEVVTTGQPVAVPDVRVDPRLWYPQHVTEYGLLSYLGLPVKVEDHVFGVLVFNTNAPHVYSKDEIAFLSTFARQGAIAIDNARLFEQARVGRERLQTLSRRLVEVQEAERRNIARELHDEIGQVLTGLKLIIEMGLRARPEVLPARLEEARALVSDLVERVRELSLNLRPAMLDDLGLLPALLWQFERYTAQTQIQVNFKHVGLAGRRFTPEVETAVYRILQEALTNVARHANTGEATVYLRADQDTLTVEVEDRGAGFDPAVVRVKRTTSGLAGMRERARLLSGHLKVESTPGAGTVVRAELPLRPGRSS